MVLLGLLHLGYTVHDFGARPRYFRPQNAELLTDMREAKTALAPHGRDYWSGILGFHLSHSLGVLQYALLIYLATTFGISWLKPVLVGVGISYGLISYRCWFRIPTIGVSIATALLIIGWLV